MFCRMPRFTSCIAVLGWVTALLAVELDAEEFSKTRFDFLIVGGGTTGLTVAATLAEDRKFTVGIIEAGDRKYDDRVLIPALAGTPLGDPEYDWLFRSTPQTAVNDRVIELARGKILGGTSALNYMGYTRGSTEEYNGWEELGNPGWNADSMFPFMKAAENWTAPTDVDFVNRYGANNDTANHGVEGGLHTTPYANYSSLTPPFFTTLENLGIPYNEATHAGNSVGSWSVTATLDARNRSRSFAANAFYEPNAGRKNLILLTGAQATKISFLETKSGKGPLKATGVIYIGRDNVTYEACVSKEVILSAGSLKNPQLLELSGQIGIGNSSLLQSLGLKPLVDLPGVGENLQDHPGVSENFQAIENATTYDTLSDPAAAQEQLQEYLNHRTGMYSAFSSSVAFIPWSMFMSQAEMDQLRGELDEAISSDLRYNTSAFRLQRKWIDNDSIPMLEVILFPRSALTVPAEDKGKFYTFNVLLMHAWSRGNVHVTSTNGLDAPRIDMAYLQAPADIDVKVFVKALRFGHTLSQTEPLGSLTTAVLGPNLNSTDEELGDWTRQNLGTNYHFVGTAAMLPRHEGGVVDSEFKVYGTKNLRIADASIFPIHVGTHPVATLYGIGVRAARTILYDNL
ncbi:alcohol oxidase [Marasmius fiardii PR-910]|nr:alcohol oxidase [Marasmius fiardii PR-910]